MIAPVTRSHRRALTALAAVALLAATLAALGGGPASAVVTVGDAETQPGFAALTDDTQEGKTSIVDCAAPGECVAVGTFSASGNIRAWGATMTGGVWGDAAELPGVAAIDTFPSVAFFALSCPEPGECLAGGYVRSGGSLAGYDAFTIEMDGGVWQNAVLMGGLTTGVMAWVTGIDCPEDGECALVGLADGHLFTADMTGGVLGAPSAVPGLDPSKESDSGLVSCVTADFCVLAGRWGNYGDRHVFSSTRDAGVWQTAVDVPNLAALDTGHSGSPYALACAAIGNCVMTGSLETATGEPPFIAEMTGGVFGDAFLMAGAAAIEDTGYGEGSRISCPAVGECVIVGLYYDSLWAADLFIAVQSGGVWGGAEPVTGLGRVPYLSREPLFRALSCSAPGACVAVGQMLPGTPGTSAFLVVISGGEVGEAEVVPGMGALQTGATSSADTISCTSDGSCVGGGFYSVTGSIWNRAFTFSVAGLEPAPAPGPGPGPAPDPGVPYPRFTG